MINKKTRLKRFNAKVLKGALKKSIISDVGYALTVKRKGQVVIVKRLFKNFYGGNDVVYKQEFKAK